LCHKGRRSATYRLATVLNRDARYKMQDARPPIHLFHHQGTKNTRRILGYQKAGNARRNRTLVRGQTVCDEAMKF
jgi:hypothetical protein